MRHLTIKKYDNCGRTDDPPKYPTSAYTTIRWIGDSVYDACCYACVVSLEQKGFRFDYNGEIKPMGYIGK